MIDQSGLERLIEIFYDNHHLSLNCIHLTDYSGTKLRFSDDITGNSTTASSLGLSRAS